MYISSFATVAALFLAGSHVASAAPLTSDAAPSIYPNVTITEAESRVEGLNKRDWMFCNVVGGCQATYLSVWGWANTANEDANRYNTVPLTPGPGGCTPVILDTNVNLGIWVCQDIYRGGNIQLGAIAPHVVNIANSCHGDFNNPSINGQEFDDAGQFNVIVACLEACVGANNGC